MRTSCAVLTVLLLIPPAAASEGPLRPRALVLERLMPSTARRSAAVTATATRRRAVLQPRPSLCPLKVLREPAFANWLDIDSDFVYVADALDDLIRVPKDGGTRTLLAAVGAEIGPFAIDDTHVYFITIDDQTTGSLYKVPKSGGTATLLVTKIAAPIDVRVDATSVYWVALGTIVGEELLDDGSIERIGKDGSNRKLLADHLNAPFTLAVDATDVYFDETGLASGSANAGLRKVSTTGGPITRLDDGLPVVAIATNASDIFYSAFDGNTAVLLRLSKTAGTPALLFQDLFAASIVVKDATIYSAVQDDAGVTSIVAVPAAGGPVRTVRTVDLDSEAFALDECAVYYAAVSRLERAPR